MPALLIGGLALGGGGFDLTARHIAGAAAWMAVILLIALGAASKASFGKPLRIAVGLVLGLAFLSAISSSWSGAPERSVIEADRVLAYLGFFLAAWLLTQTTERRQRFAEGMTIAIAFVAALALASRLLPGILTVADEGGARLSYPLDYWNAEGVLFGIGFTLLIWMSRRGSREWLRGIAVAAMPMTLLAIFFTYSRGGATAALCGLVVMLFLSRDRLWSIAMIGIAALCTAPAMIAVLDRRELLDHITGQTAETQGLQVFAVLVAGTVVALLAWQALGIVESRRGPRMAKAIDLSRSPKLLGGVAAAAITAFLVLAVAFGGKAWDRFSSEDIQFPNQPEKRFTQVSGLGRDDFWRVSFDTFADHPIGGRGAGTYELAWEQDRSIPMVVRDAHSLYFEAFAELGLLGGSLVLAIVAWFLVGGYGAWRAAEGASRERHAALLAVMAAFAVSAALDWSWEMASLGSVFFIAAGVLMGARSEQVTPAEDRVAQRPDDRTSYALGVAGLGLAWLSILALAMPLAVQYELNASKNADSVESAVSKAENARAIEPWAASPYTQLGLLAEFQGDYPTAAARLTQAIDRDSSDWLLYYTRARIFQSAGEIEAARRDLREASRLNPLAPELQDTDPLVQAVGGIR